MCPRCSLQVDRLGGEAPLNRSPVSARLCGAEGTAGLWGLKAEPGPQEWHRELSSATWKELCQAEPAHREGLPWDRLENLETTHTHLRACRVVDNHGNHCKYHRPYRDS